MEEQWMTIDGIYSVSDCGRVRRDIPGRGVRAGKMLKGYIASTGYPAVGMRPPGASRKPTYIHKLVAAAFLGSRPEGREVNHKNGIKTDNRASNLEYVTSSENNYHAWRLGLRIANPALGEDHGCAKLTEAAVLQIRIAAANGVPQRTIARQHAVHQATVNGIIKRKLWKHVP